MAAKYSTALAEVLESLNDLSAAISRYLKAGDIYVAEDSPSACTKVLLRAASLYAKLSRWNEAIQLFDRVIDTSVKTRYFTTTFKRTDWLVELVKFLIFQK